MFIVEGAVASLVGAWIEMMMLYPHKLMSLVASLVGAWIEIEFFGKPYEECYKSHPSWVRELKSYKPSGLISTLRRIPRGCVNWNITVDDPIRPQAESHPSWVRELKNNDNGELK